MSRTDVARSVAPVAARPGRAPRRSVVAGVLGSRVGPFIGLGVLLGALLLFQVLTEPTFASPNNLTGIGRAMAVPLLVAAAMAIVLLTGGVDLSIGATLALSGTLYAKLVTSDVPGGPALLTTLAFGAIVGFTVNGVLIGRLNMSFFVVTIGTLSFYRGLVFLWTETNTIDMYGDPVSNALGDRAIIGEQVPIGLLVSVGVVVILFFVLRFTTFGRSVYAVGGNREASELSGLRSGWIIAAVYGISGLLAALASVMTIGRATIADPNMGTNIELGAAAAALLGGIALSGGVGSIWGAALGVAFLAVLSNSLSLAGAPTSWQLIVTGAILVVAVYLDRARSRAERARF